MRRGFKIFWVVLGAIVALLLLIAILMQTPAVQTYVAKKVMESIENKIHGRIEFSKIHLKPFNALVIKDAVIIDNEPDSLNGEILDTLAKAGTVTASFSLRGLPNKEGLHIWKATVSDAQFMLATGTRGANVGRVFSSGKKKNKTKKGEPGNILDIRTFDIRNFRFRLVNTKKPAVKDFGINWKDLDIVVHRLKGKRLAVAGGDVTGEATLLSFTEKSGYDVSEMSGKVKVGHGETVIDDLRIKDLRSDLSFKQYKMSYESVKSFSDFLNEVRITSTFEESLLDFESLSYYAQALRGRNTVLHIKEGYVDGPVSDMNVRGLTFSEANSGISGTLSGRLYGLPDISDFGLDFTAKDLNFTTEGIEDLLHGWAPGVHAAISRFAPSQSLTFNGTVSGLLDRLALDGDITSDNMGSLKADVGFKHLILKSGSPTGLDGFVSTHDLDIGKMLNAKQLGPCTMRTSLHASFGKGATSVKIDTLFVDRLQAMGYDYSNIIGAGTYSQDAFDGRIVCSDPNLNFIFQGIFTLSDKTQNGVYKFYADLGYADLEKLNLEKFGIKRASLQINANYINVDRKDLLGDLDVNNIVLENDQGRNDVGDICIKSHSTDNIHRLNITSDFLSGTYVGDKAVTSIVGDIIQLTANRDLPSLVRKKHDSWHGETFDIDLHIHDKKSLFPSLIPGFYIADSTFLRLDINSAGDVRASVNSPRIAKGRNYLKDLDLAIDNLNGSINGTINSSELNVSTMNFKNSDFMVYADDDHFGFGATYDNQTEEDNRGEIYLSGDIYRDEDSLLVIKGQTLPSNIYVDGNGWNITQSGFEMKGKDFSLEKISAICESQSLSIEGGLSRNKSDTLKVELEDYDIGLANNVMGQDLGIKGSVTGKIFLISPRESSSGLLMNLVCDSTWIGGYEMGSLQVGSALDNASSSLHFIIRNDLYGKRNIDVDGIYSIRRKTVNATVDLSGFNLGYASPFLSSVFSRIEGSISGRLNVSGAMNKLQIASQDTKIDESLLEVAFTKVPYHVSGPFHIDASGLHFDNNAISDNYDGTGTISGGLLFKDMKDFRLDTKISMNQMEVLNTTSADNKSFNGNVFASGDVSITGPFNAISIDVNARTAKNGTIHIPLDNASGDKNSNLLTFKEAYKEVYVDPYDLMMNNINTVQKKKNDLGVRLRINVDPLTQALVEVDRSAGNVLSGNGNGLIDITVRPSRDVFTIGGDYTISQGNFHFNAMNIAQRDFTLSDGSTIRFNGDIMDSDLNIEGVYTTKASIATLISDTSAVSTRRIVNCQIGITGKLREPSLKFEIEIPDLDPTTKVKVESALNTEDKVQRQFLSLLISNSFIPNEQSGIVNNTATLYSSVAEIMSGQLNSILDKLNIPLDLGLNYQSSESGANIFDVAVSTQLFNNRVIVNGAFGNRDYSNSGTQGSDVVGDIDIEIKLDKPGQVRLTLFSHSADDYTNYLDNTQRNGVGIAYQVEFNNFTDFIKRLFTPKKKREEAAAEVQEKEKKVIRIEK